MIKKYKHRDGFDGNLDHVEWDGICVIMVYADGSRKPAPHHDAADVRSFVDMGWWVEEELDQYGNPISGDRVINCCFPDCGCDGARLCMAENGPSSVSYSLNLERK